MRPIHTFQLTDEELVLEGQMSSNGYGFDPKIWNEAERRGITSRLISIPENPSIAPATGTQEKL